VSRRFATGCIVAGTPIAIVDAWLSMQAMFGFLVPHNLLSYTVVVFCGMFFTSFIVISEASGKRKEWFGDISHKFLAAAAWVTIFLVDTGTSILCAIRYGMLGHPFNHRIEISKLVFKSSNWPMTSVYVAFVVVFLLGCILLGRAFETLLHGDND